MPTNIMHPARLAEPVTPSDVTAIPATSALYVGVSGNLTVEMVGSSTPVLLTNVPVGFTPLRVVKVRQTGTTASDIVAVWS